MRRNYDCLCVYVCVFVSVCVYVCLCVDKPKNKDTYVEYMYRSGTETLYYFNVIEIIRDKAISEEIYF